MLRTIRLTSKRQATFPAQVLEEMGVGPGDELYLERREGEKGAEWVLSAAAPKPERPAWFGAAQRYAKGKSTDMEDIRRSVEIGRAKEWRNR